VTAIVKETYLIRLGNEADDDLEQKEKGDADVQPDDDLGDRGRNGIGLGADKQRGNDNHANDKELERAVFF